MRTATLAGLAVAAAGLVLGSTTPAAAHSFDKCHEDEKFLCSQTTGNQDWETCAWRALTHCTLHGHGSSSGGGLSPVDSFSGSSGASDPLAKPANRVNSSTHNRVR